MGTDRNRRVKSFLWKGGCIVPARVLILFNRSRLWGQSEEIIDLGREETMYCS